MFSKLFDAQWPSPTGLTGYQEYQILSEFRTSEKYRAESQRVEKKILIYQYL